jgi:hypothetical protein
MIVGPSLYIANYSAGSNQQSIFGNNTYYNSGYKAVTGDTAASMVNFSQGNVTFDTAATVTTNSAQSFTTKLYIKNDGNVGIGTTSPAHPLSVQAANAKITACSTADSQVIGFQARYLLDHATLYGSFEYHTGDAQLYIDNNFPGNNGVYGDINFRNKDNAGSSLVSRMKIKGSTGNVGIGETNPVAKLAIKGANDTNFEIQPDISSGVNRITNFNRVTSAYKKLRVDASEHEFYISGNPKVNIDSSGIVLVGTQSRAVGIIGDVNAFGVSADGGPNNPVVAFADHDATVNVNSVIQEISFKNDTAFTAYYVKFTDRDGLQGTISGSGTGSVSFNTTSDERLKENIVTTSNKLEKIKQIQVRDFNYIGKDVTTTGLIAQELNEIIPDVVREGSEDAAKDPWAVDYGKLTPYLIKAVQEQQTLIESLTARIETLEG